MPEAVVAAAQRWAAEVGPDGPVVAVGGRTRWLVGGAVDELAVETRAPVGLVAHDPAELSVVVHAGTPVDDVEAELAVHGQTLGVGARPGGTIGGAIAVGDSRVDRRRYGSAATQVLEAWVVTSDGLVGRCGGPTVKNVSGFDLARLLVGSLGTLALIATVRLRTHPLSPARQWMAGPADPAVVDERLHRPAAVLWDGELCHALLDGVTADVEAQQTVARDVGLAPADGPPRLGRYRWNLDPAQLAAARRVPNNGPLGPGPWVAEWGVGTVHHSRPMPPSPPSDVTRRLNLAVKDRFDPLGRLAPGRDVIDRWTHQ